MKTSLPFLLLLLVSCRLWALDPVTPASRYEHLATVNREWARQMPVPVDELLQPAVFNTDQDRIQAHLSQVEAWLRQQPATGLSLIQNARRQQQLNVLHQYWQAGIFPTNHFHAQRQPYFRDNFGVLCAVGYLLWQDGQHTLVEQIRRENNYGYLGDLAGHYPQIALWAEHNGFTVDELAWIQPAYDPPRPTFEAWGTGAGLNPGGRINVLEKNADETLLFAAGLFSTIDGVAANNIAVWDGTSWSPVGAGLSGEIHAMHYIKEYGSPSPAGYLYVGGNFFLPGHPNKKNVAEYNLTTGEWRGLQTGDMQGTVYALRYFPPYAISAGLLIGGDFQRINGGLHPYTGICQTYNALWLFDNHFRTDGPVRTIGAVDAMPMIGGEFQQVWSKVTQSWLDAPHFAYYSYPDWAVLPQALPPVRALGYHHGNVFAGYAVECLGPGIFPPCSGLSILKAGLWFRSSQGPGADSLTHGFFAEGDRFYAYGGFFSGHQSTGYGTGMVYFNGDDLTPFGVFQADSTVRAAFFFQGKIHVAGDFQHLWYEEEAFPGLARFTPNYGGFSGTGTAASSPVRVQTFFDRLVLRGEDLTEPGQLRVFDLQGRLMAQENLLPGQGDAGIEASVLPAGIYLWQLRTGGRTQAGKWVVQTP